MDIVCVMTNSTDHHAHQQSPWGITTDSVIHFV